MMRITSLAINSIEDGRDHVEFIGDFLELLLDTGDVFAK